MPCYNAGWCLDKCLSSFFSETSGISDKLEIIIINDGSTDDTLKIASEYEGKYPDIFLVIDKPNGGHGSGINAAIKQASGKYFKVIDADDWVLTENLGVFLDMLSVSNADVILTHFHTVDMTSSKKKEYKTRDIQLDKLYTLDKFTMLSGEIYNCTVLHGLTYRTEIYRKSGTVLSEGIFYEDQEYATLPFLSVEKIFPADMFLYEYMIGNVNQSVSDKNQVKRLSHIEQVTKKLFGFYKECKNSGISGGKLRYAARKATDMLLSYYVIAMIKNPDKRAGRFEAERIRRELSEIAPELVSSTNAKYRLAKIMNRLRFNGKTLELMKNPLPYAIFRKLFKKNRG